MGGDRPDGRGQQADAAGTAVPDAGPVLTRNERRVAVRRRRTWLERVLVGAIVVVSSVLVAVGSGDAYLRYRFDQVAKVTVKHLRAAPAGLPFNVLLIGSDTRAGISPADQTHFGNQANAGGQRRDVVKIVHVVPATGQASVLSIPRDTMVTVAGDTDQTGTYDRINATDGNGPDQLVQTIEANSGVPIAHVVQINFVGFRGAVDAIGGINLDFPHPARGASTGLNITTSGCQHLDGGYALAVARSRHSSTTTTGTGTTIPPATSGASSARTPS